MAKIYVASSWRNQHQPQVVSFLREQGHEVYDFRHPAGKLDFSGHRLMKIGGIGVQTNIGLRLNIPLHRLVSNLILMQCNGQMFVFLYCLVDALHIRRQDG